MRLENKIVLVTASTKGIGYETVKKCAKEGATVYMAARNMSLAKEKTDEFYSKGFNVKFVYNDADNEASFRDMITTVIENEGRIDVLINNFGTSDPQKDLDLAHTDTDTFISTISKNLRSVFIASQEAAKHMAKSGGGSIINISSVGGIVPDISQIGYGTSKAAINYLTKLIAVQEAKNNIRCNAILPGMTATEAVKNKLTDNFKDLFIKHIPLGRMGLPEEIANAAVFLASDESAYTTGQILTISGGFGLATPVYSDLVGKADKR
ncbi:MAG: SDR family oxidoreductase [Lachnospiraceae bacterium]|nr:SDR family oxidoreductase [Lachnospiraceae bacterium]